MWQRPETASVKVAVAATIGAAGKTADLTNTTLDYGVVAWSDELPLVPVAASMSTVRVEVAVLPERFKSFLVD